MSENCFICDTELDNGTKVTEVKSKGIEPFRLASKKRKDGKRDFLMNKESLRVHEKCRTQYIKEKLIDAHLKRVSKSVENQSKLRSAVQQFSFRTHCFLCGEEIKQQFKTEEIQKAITKRNIVYTVRSLTVLEKVKQLSENRDDEWGRAIIHRLDHVTDLVAADGQYHLKCMKKLYQRTKPTETQKRGPFSSDIDTAMQVIFSYLEENEEQCQFSIEELTDQIKAGEYCPSVKTIKAHLLKKYGEDIVISTTANKVPVVCFKNTGHKILTDVWYQQRCSSPQEERRRIVQTAAKIVMEDIRSQVYETTQYPPPDDFLKENESLIPETLKIFTETLLFRKRKRDLDKWKNRCTALAHSIITAVRPRSFLSPLQIGLAAYLYKKFGSRKLIDVLSSLGYCSSYHEAVRFEVSSIMMPPFEIESEAFSQFVYDNADFNTHTLDGHNTFHVMGGIQCITPKYAITSNRIIPRVKKIPAAQVVGSFGAVQLKHFDRVGSGLESVKIENIGERYAKSRIVPSVCDLLWLYGKSQGIAGIPGWNSFMEMVFADLPFQQTYVACLPFVNAPPNNRDTIYTVLLSASEKSKSLRQHTSFVTFDQPLYLKAREILSIYRDDPNLKNVVVRLGGFHLLMSFMGAIGYIMNGSGLKEMFQTIYAVNSTEKIMMGHAYSRAVRAHILAHAALAARIMESTTFSTELKARLEEILYDCDRTVVRFVHDDEFVRELKKLFDTQVKKNRAARPYSKAVDPIL